MFWATNARFSNDDEERSLGIKLAQRIIKPENDTNGFADFLEHFIVCFCEEEDTLSQWRGYAPYGGISIGFDFNIQAPFTILPQESKRGENGYAKEDQDNLTCYLRAIKVKYYSESITEKELLEDCNFESSTVLESELAAEKKKRFFSKIPYIKHKCFAEEKELRIVVDHNDFSKSDHSRLNRCVHFRGERGKKVPFVVLKPGSLENSQRDCVVRIRSKNLGSDFDKCLNGLKQYMKDIGDQSNIVVCNKKNSGLTLGDDICFGCTRRRWYRPGWRKRLYKNDKDARAEHCVHHDPDKRLLLPFKEGNSIMISQGHNQEEVFYRVHGWAKEQNMQSSKTDVDHEDSKIINWKVWCEGHLPIRSIMVGPCKEKKEMVESIKNFCLYSALYWLRDVEVVDSKIPYRVPV